MADTTDEPTTIGRSRRWHQLLWLVAGIILGALIILVIRFATYHPDTVHYHANFAVYINGQQELFKDPSYYEEVKICDLHGTTPQSRTHMHDEDAGVIHVHDAAVTWGQFFENLGWYVGPDFIRSRTTMYQADGSNKLNIILNGQDLTDQTVITNQVIRDKDRLLLSYGPADASTLGKQYKSVPANAAHFDTTKDPASCGGGESPTVQDRLKQLF